MDFNCSSNRINVTDQPIKSVNVRPAGAWKEHFDKALENLYPGDILVLSNTKNSYFSDGLYIVKQKDTINKGVVLSEINKDLAHIHNNNTLADAQSVNGDVQVIGHLSVNA